MNNNTKLTFNEQTYEFTYFLGISKTNPKDTYPCYGVYINGERKTDWFLQEDYDKTYHLYYKDKYVGLEISIFTLENVVKLLSHIRNVIGDNLLNVLVENPNNFDETIK